MKKGVVELEISNALTKWEKAYLGRGPISVKTDIVRNLIIVQLMGVLTPAEKELARDREGLLSIKKTRMDLVESGSHQLEQLIRELTAEEVESFHTDISTRSGERVMVFILKQNLERKLL